jgi:hypothetical protein
MNQAVALVYKGDPNVGAKILNFSTGSLSDGIKSSDSSTDSKVKPICGWVAQNSDYVIVYENG